MGLVRAISGVYEEHKDPEIPNNKPRTVRWLFTLEYSRGPGQDDVEVYARSSNRSSSRLILWQGYDDAYGRLVWAASGWRPCKGISLRQAAIYLLIDYWTIWSEETEDDIGRFDVIDTGFIDPDTLGLIMDRVCPADNGEPHRIVPLDAVEDTLSTTNERNMSDSKDRS